METRVETISPSLLPTLLGWWSERDLGEMPETLLPPMGSVSSDADGPAASAWIYQPAGCPVWLIDWLVTRPGLRAKAARVHCRAVFSTIEVQAHIDNIKHVLASVSRDGMIREAIACGFHIVSKDNTHLALNL